MFLDCGSEAEKPATFSWPSAEHCSTVSPRKRCYNSQIINIINKYDNNGDSLGPEKNGSTAKAATPHEIQRNLLLEAAASSSTAWRLFSVAHWLWTNSSGLHAHYAFFFFFFHSDWNRSDWRFQFNCLHWMCSIPYLVCLHERLHLADRWKCLGIGNKTTNNEGLSRYWDAATVEAQRGPAVRLWVFSWMFFFQRIQYFLLLFWRAVIFSSLRVCIKNTVRRHCAERAQPWSCAFHHSNLTFNQFGKMNNEIPFSLGLFILTEVFIWRIFLLTPITIGIFSSMWIWLL